MRSHQEELECIDAVELGLSVASAVNAKTPQCFEDMSFSRPDSQLSTVIDPLYALGIVIYYLANGPEDSNEMPDLLQWFIHHIPWSLLEAFLRFDSPAVRQSWSKLLDWPFVLGETFFGSLAHIMLGDSHWIECHGACVLITAAFYDLHEICTLLIRLGISVNQRCSFPPARSLRIHQFSSFTERKTARSYNTHWDLYSRSSPLIEAAVNGNIKSVCALLDGGADVNLRCDGYTAAGYLLLALNKDNLKRDHRYATMQLLIERERGADVNEPIRAHPRFEHSESTRDVGDNEPNFSDETLLDEAQLTSNSDLAELLQRFDSTPSGILTIAGIVSNAEKGIEDLQAYLHNACFPRGVRRRYLQELSLYRCFARSKAFSTMITCGFDLRLPSIGKFGLYTSLDFRLDRFGDAESIRLIVTKVFENMDFTSLSKDIISLLLRKDKAMKAGVIEACLNTGRGEDLLHLLDSGLDMTGQDGAVLMAEAARRDNSEVVILLQSYGTNINGLVRAKTHGYSVLLLAATWMRVDNELGLLQGNNNRSANIDMLRFLMQQGAHINNCRPILMSNQSRRLYDCIDVDRLQWLIDSGLDLTGESMCNIMLRRLRGRGSAGMLQSLLQRDIPLFSPNEP